MKDLTKNPLMMPLLLVAASILVLMVVVRFSYTSFYGPPTTEVKESKVAMLQNKQAPLIQQNIQKPLKRPKNDIIAQTIVKTDELKEIRALEAAQLAKRHTLLPQSGDPKIGRTNAPLTLIVFTDPLCAPCRTTFQNVRDTLAPFKRKMVIVEKFLPQTAGDADGGIFARVAAAEDVYEDFLDLLNTTSGALPQDKLIQLLEDSGVPFERQRSLMGSMMPSILGTMETNKDEANRVGVLSPPAFFLNGYRMDAEPFALKDIAKNAQKLLNGQPLK